MGAMETERRRQRKTAECREGLREIEQEKKGERENSDRDNQRGGEKREICSNSTFLPLILLHNRTVKSMWSLATSCSPAPPPLSLSLTPSIYLSFSLCSHCSSSLSPSLLLTLVLPVITLEHTLL